MTSSGQTGDEQCFGGNWQERGSPVFYATGSKANTPDEVGQHVVCFCMPFGFALFLMHVCLGNSRTDSGAETKESL